MQNKITLANVHVAKFIKCGLGMYSHWTFLFAAIICSTLCAVGLHKVWINQYIVSSCIYLDNK